MCQLFGSLTLTGSNNNKCNYSLILTSLKTHDLIILPFITGRNRFSCLRGQLIWGVGRFFFFGTIIPLFVDFRGQIILGWSWSSPRPFYIIFNVIFKWLSWLNYMLCWKLLLRLEMWFTDCHCLLMIALVIKSVEICCFDEQENTDIQIPVIFFDKVCSNNL